MSKQRKTIRHVPGVDPSLEHASALVQEYTRKLRAISRRIREVREKHLATMEKRCKRSSPNSDNPGNRTPQEQTLWFEVEQSFRSRHDEYAEYLRALVPQARQLAQHVSQLITHGTNQTIVKIELSLRVAELESAIQTAGLLSNSALAFIPD
jgi:hypothetical protein